MRTLTTPTCIRTGILLIGVLLGLQVFCARRFRRLVSPRQRG
ncbi:hypothetical protein [Frankia sp. Cppng1_Ct_nod]|nr:hypothetical protein [Frankia sp. Cppng1_Ct_nod]